MSGTEVVLARLLQGGWPLDPSPGLADPTGPLWKHSRPSVGAHSGQSFVLRPPGRRLQTFRSPHRPAGFPLPAKFS